MRAIVSFFLSLSFSLTRTHSLSLKDIITTASSAESIGSLDYESGSDSGNEISSELNSKQQLAMVRVRVESKVES
jgi:hypothetical protein